MIDGLSELWAGIKSEVVSCFQQTQRSIQQLHVGYGFNLWHVPRGQWCPCGMSGCPINTRLLRHARDRTRGYKWRAGTRTTKRHARARKRLLGRPS